MTDFKKSKLLGISASLRNARWGVGNKKLIGSLKNISSEDELFSFLEKESELHIENFLEAGCRKGKPFNEIYKNLQANKGTKGLCNSEVALATALWAAYQKNVDIEHLSLSEYFTSFGQVRKSEILKEKLLSSDGLLISGPVYFGDRGSLSQDFVNFIKDDISLREHLKGKIYGGITVGAKRNGGQETTLVYQMLDFVELGLLAVGNDSETSAQYGGTCHAGDVGTMYKDREGLKTAMGTGRRVAKLIRKLGLRCDIKGPVKVLFLILQDTDGFGKRKVQELIESIGNGILPEVINIAEKNISRCLACDICPTKIDIDNVYRCVITSKNDDFKSMHQDLLNYDAILPVVVSVSDRSTLKTNYQAFIERTRYLRRGDYVLTDILIAPLIFEEIGVREYYSIRTMTSMIRHHTIMAKPIIGYINKGEIFNPEQLMNDFRAFIQSTRRIAAVRLAEVEIDEDIKYNPVGYILSSKKDAEDERLEKRKLLMRNRLQALEEEAGSRLANPIK